MLSNTGQRKVNLLIKNINSLDELLREIDKESRDFDFLAGGTDIMSSIHKGIFKKELLFNLSSLKSTLSFICEKKTSVEIGCMTSLFSIHSNDLILHYLPQLSKALRSIGSVQIQNMATLAGNIANASPAADSVPVLLVKKGVVKLKSINRTRVIPIENFFINYKQTLQNKNEIIYSIEIEKNRPEEISDFIKIGTKKAMAVSKLNLSYSIIGKKVLFASGSVYKFPRRLYNVEKNWFEKNLSKHIWLDILSEDIKPIDDIRSSSLYRSNILNNLIFDLYTKFQ